MKAIALRSANQFSFVTTTTLPAPPATIFPAPPATIVAPSVATKMCFNDAEFGRVGHSINGNHV